VDGDGIGVKHPNDACARREILADLPLQSGRVVVRRQNLDRKIGAEFAVPISDDLSLPFLADESHIRGLHYIRSQTEPAFRAALSSATATALCTLPCLGLGGGVTINSPSSSSCRLPSSGNFSKLRHSRQRTRRHINIVRHARLNTTESAAE
jgi:hypothetical protein